MDKWRLRQTAKNASDFAFFSSNPCINLAEKKKKKSAFRANALIVLVRRSRKKLKPTYSQSEELLRSIVKSSGISIGGTVT